MRLGFELHTSSAIDSSESLNSSVWLSMADPYQKVKGGRLTFKGGAIATLSKSIDKKKTKKKTKNKDNPKYSLDGGSEFPPPPEEEEAAGGGGEGSGAAGGEIYTIDAAKRMNYEELFPVETKKRGYDPKSSNVRSAEDALDDRVKKKADRYCK
ncbi:unnamed protein product [Camellia sinensis]